MGSNLSKFRKHIISGDEYAAIQLYTHNSDLHKGLDPNISYGESYDHNTPMHYVAKHAMKSLLRIFLAELGGNPNKKNNRNESVLHALCSVEGKLTMVQQRKRVECLSLILQWCGPTLQDGRAEKADLTAVDEKENTALHYAACSGIQKLVEMLVSSGAPLFVENHQRDTPCDCAEKTGHDAIALYLESKMVFSDDDQKPEESDLMNSYDLDEGYSGLRAQDLQEAKDQLLVETSDMLHVPLFTAEALLRNHEWSREMLLEAWIKDPVSCCEKCGVTPPLTLFSNWSGADDSPGQCDPNDVELKSPTLVTPVLSFERVCGICTCTISHLEEPVPMPCGHQFCRKCWGMYLDGKIAAGEAHSITCAGYMCNKLVPVDIIETLVSRDMASRYLQFDIKAFVESNPSIKWCPHPGCGRAVRLPEAQKVMSPSHRGSGFVSSPSETSHAVDCGNGHTFCWECLGEAHEPASCENWKNWYSKIAEIRPEELTGTDEKTENSANCLWLVTNSKPCPNCKSPIQKNEGCNHMKCSKCKHDFCWVCLEPWKKHSTATGGYFRCNRYEIVKKVEEQQDALKAEIAKSIAEVKNKRMQELNRFVHYYSRFKNHENSYKLEEPLFNIAREKMMVLARAVTTREADISVGTKFIQDAVVQLLKARHVLKCSYAFGYYLEDGGYKKPIFEFMQTELEECTESLSEMVARPFLRTPRNKIVQTAILVQRKRHEFVSAIGKGLVPPDTSPERERRKTFAYKLDEETKKALMASLEEDPDTPWVKDPSGRHANVSALFDWPEESDESDSEIPSPSKFPSALSSLVSSIGHHKSVGGNRTEPGYLTTQEVEGHAPSSSVTSAVAVAAAAAAVGALGASTSADNLPGKCARPDCHHTQARNPRTGELHQHCSIKCMRTDHIHKRLVPQQAENVVDFNMDLLRALEMSRLQYIRETGSSVDDEEEHRSNESTRPPNVTSSSSAGASQQHLMIPDNGADISQLNLREEEKQMSVAIELSMEEYSRVRRHGNSGEDDEEDEDDDGGVRSSGRGEVKSKSCETLSSTAFSMEVEDDDDDDYDDGARGETFDGPSRDAGRLRIHSDQEPQAIPGGRWKRRIPARRSESKGPSYIVQASLTRGRQRQGELLAGGSKCQGQGRKCFAEGQASSLCSSSSSSSSSSCSTTTTQAYLGRSDRAPPPLPVYSADAKRFGIVIVGGGTKEIDAANVTVQQETDKTSCFRNKDFKRLFLSEDQPSYKRNFGQIFQEPQIRHSSSVGSNRKARSSSNGPFDRKKLLQQQQPNGKRPIQLHGFCFKGKVVKDQQLVPCQPALGVEPAHLHKHKSRLSAHYHPHLRSHQHHQRQQQMQQQQQQLQHHQLHFLHGNHQHHHHHYQQQQHHHQHHQHHKNLCGQNKCNFTKDETVVSVLDLWHNLPHSYGFYLHREKPCLPSGELTPTVDPPPPTSDHVPPDPPYPRDGHQKPPSDSGGQRSPRRKSASAYAESHRPQHKTHLSRGRSENSHLLLPWASFDDNSQEGGANIDPVDMVISPRILESLLQGAEGYYADPPNPASEGVSTRGQGQASSACCSSSSTSDLLASPASLGRLKPAMFSFPDMTSIGGDGANNNNSSNGNFCFKVGCSHNHTNHNRSDRKNQNDDTTGSRVEIFIAPWTSPSSRFVVRSFQSEVGMVSDSALFLPQGSSDPEATIRTGSSKIGCDDSSAYDVDEALVVLDVDVIKKGKEEEEEQDNEGGETREAIAVESEENVFV